MDDFNEHRQACINLAICIDHKVVRHMALNCGVQSIRSLLIETAWIIFARILSQYQLSQRNSNRNLEKWVGAVGSYSYR